MDNVDDALQEQELATEQISETARGRELLRTIDFGLQVEAFKRSEVYRRLFDDSEAERHELIAMVVALDPDDPEQRKMIQQHRRRIGMLEHWQDLFDRYVHEGKTAETAFHELDG